MGYKMGKGYPMDPPMMKVMGEIIPLRIPWDALWYIYHHGATLGILLRLPIGQPMGHLVGDSMG